MEGWESQGERGMRRGERKVETADHVGPPLGHILKPRNDTSRSHTDVDQRPTWMRTTLQPVFVSREAAISFQKGRQSPVMI